MCCGPTSTSQADRRGVRSFGQSGRGIDVKDLKGFIAKVEAAGVKLDADGAYRVNDVGVGIAFITDPWGTRIELNERPKAVYLP